MKTKTTEEKIEFLVHKWIDEAQLETILEYAAEKLTAHYHQFKDEVIEEVYKDACEGEDQQESRIGYITRMRM